MEITIIKRVYLTEEIPDDLSIEQIEETVNDMIDSLDIDDWNETDYRGKESYEVYDTYSGCTILNLER